MKNYLVNIDKRFLDVIKKIGQESDRQKMSAYIVGGIVRDILLKKKNYDLDIVIEGNVKKLAQSLAKKLKAKAIFYEQFGTATLNLENKLRIDLVTVRKESYARSGALPNVKLGTLRDDLFRRDFTINAMAMGINHSNFGHLIDLFNGKEDIRHGKIRVLHDKSFIDDPTRILRAVRFEQRFQFHIERHTLSLLKKAIKNKLTDNVTPTRYFVEFKKMLCEKSPVPNLRRLKGLGGFYFLHPQFKINLRHVNAVHQNIQKMRRKSMYKDQNQWWMVYLLAIVTHLSGDQRKGFGKKVHLRREEAKSLAQLEDCSEIMKQFLRKSLKRSEILKMLHSLEESVIFYLRAKTNQQQSHQYIDRYWSVDKNVQLSISGEDLKQIGLHEGKKMGRMLNEIYYHKIDKHIQTKQEELKLAKQLY